MKKIVGLTIVMAGLVVSVIAQKGSVLLYGNVGFSSVKEASNDKETRITVLPGLGYQFNDSWTVGIQGGIVSNKIENETNNFEIRDNTVQIGHFLRYTKDLSNVFFVFGQLDASFVSNKNEEIGVNETKATGCNIGLTPAVGVNVKNRFALNFSFGGLGFSTLKVDGAINSSSAFGLTFGQIVNIGISKNFLFRKKL